MKKKEAQEMVNRAEHAVEVCEQAAREAIGSQVDVKRAQLGKAKELLKKAQDNLSNAEDC